MGKQKQLAKINIKQIRADKTGKPYIVVANHLARNGFVALYENMQMKVPEHTRPFFQKEVRSNVTLNFYYWNPERNLFNL